MLIKRMGGLSHRFAVKVFHRVIKIFTADVRAKISQYFQFQRIVITITVSVISRICIKIAQSVQKPFADVRSGRFFQGSGLFGYSG